MVVTAWRPRSGAPAALTSELAPLRVRVTLIASGGGGPCAVRVRRDEIAAKYIRPEEDTTDFAVMYVPADGVSDEAILREKSGGTTESTLDQCRRYRVLLASPHTF